MPPRQSPWFATLRERLDCMSIPEPNSGCTLWLGSVYGIGYGKVSWQGRQRPAHRMAWIDAHGSIPNGLLVLHKCDVPSCINVDHLFLGTDADNAADKARKMRTTTTLSRDTVMAIYRDTRPRKMIELAYGVSRCLVESIQSKRRFGWVTNSAAEPQPPTISKES